MPHIKCALKSLSLSGLAATLSLVLLAPQMRGQAAGQPSTKNGEWPYYTADAKGTKYSPLDQINASNFNRLEVAWRFKTDNLGPRPEYKLEGTPLMVKGVIIYDGGHAAIRHRTRREDRRADLVAQPPGRTSRRDCAAAALGTRPVLLD